MANFLTLLFALFAMTAFGESFCDRREGENEERERVADQRRAMFSVCMSFLDSFATCRRAGFRRQSACRRQPLSPLFFCPLPLHPPPHTQTKKQPPPPPTPGAGEQRRDWGAFSSLFDLLFSISLPSASCLSPPASLKDDPTSKKSLSLFPSGAGAAAPVAASRAPPSAPPLASESATPSPTTRTTTATTVSGEDEWRLEEREEEEGELKGKKRKNSGQTVPPLTLLSYSPLFFRIHKINRLLQHRRLWSQDADLRQIGSFFFAPLFAFFLFSLSQGCLFFCERVSPCAIEIPNRYLPNLKIKRARGGEKG